MTRAQSEKERTAQAKRIIEQLFNYYGIDRSPDHAAEVLVWAALDGFLKAPRRKGAGKPATWQGKLGKELLWAVEWEIVKDQAFDKATVAKLRAMPFRQRQAAARSLAKHNLTTDAALERLIEQQPDKWGNDFDKLRRNYYRARKRFG